MCLVSLRIKNQPMSESKKRSVILRIAKILGKTILTLVIVTGILLFCIAKFIDSKYLAELVEREANERIDGHLKIGKIKLGFRPAYPVLGVEVEDLTLISQVFESLDASQRGSLPDYADSLLTLDYMSGALDIKRLLMDNELALHDVVLRGLGANLVIAHNGKANYQLMKTQPDTARSHKKIPSFKIDRFALENPKEMRFYNAADSLAASVLLLTDVDVDGSTQPSYRLMLNGSVSDPRASLITNLSRIEFGLNGRVYWTPESPGLVAVDEMEIRGAFLKAVISGEIDLADAPIVRRAAVDLDPVALTDLIEMLPDSIKDYNRLYEPYFATDLTVGGRIELTAPMNLATDTLPSARIDLSVPSGSMSYGKARFEEIALDATITTMSDQPDSTMVDIRRCVIAGPATRFEATATLSRPVSDPTFTADMRGEIDLGNLPPIVSRHVPGYLSGVIGTDLKTSGKASLLDKDAIHRLVADGSITARDIYFLAADTCSLVEVGEAKIEFDSRQIIGDAPALSTKITVDTATVLTGGIDLLFGNLSIGASVDNTASTAKIDDDHAAPVKADLNVRRFNILTVTDSAGARIQNITGPVRLTKREGPIPEILADIRIGKASAGTLSDRIILNNTRVKASLYKMPQPPNPKKTKAKKAVGDREYKYISPAAVHRYVYKKRHNGKHIKRVYGEIDAEDEEVLVWNLTRQFRGFLNEWKLSGRLNTSDAGLLMPQFPIRNKISAMDITFNNDTVAISNITMRAGRSDITLSGRITNVRRALTSGPDNNLKANLSLLSNTIDVNELSATVFTGASYISDRNHGKAQDMRTHDDKSLADMLDALSKKGAGHSSPVLIPVNLRAKVRVEANQLLYGEMNLQNMGCDLLVYDGGVNLHNLTASSDAGTLSMSALYSAPKIKDMYFGFGMELRDFNIARFVKLVPAIDSITPMLHDFSGMIGAELAATCRIDKGMNIDLPSLDAAIRIKGDSLAFIDPEKYRKLGKWLGFKNKADNTIHSLNVEMTVADGLLRVYPFTFDIDRYRLGVYGSNDMTMNFDYHLSVLKSPLPFKFGITIKGNPKKYKVRFGGAKFNDYTAVESVNMVNEARINLVDQIQNVFERGVRNSRFAKLKVAYPAGFSDDEPALSEADSLRLIQEGIIDSPAEVKTPQPAPEQEKKTEKKKHKRFLFF